jgi:hypothetical protein
MPFLPDASGGSAMNIKGIQTSQIVPPVPRSHEGSNSNAGAGSGLSPEPSSRVPPGSSASTNVSRTPLVEARTLANHIDYLKEQLDKILVDFPPFFPPGTYQRADLIKGIRSIQDEVEKSSVTSDMKEEISSQKLTENATDLGISAALDKLLSLRNDIAKKIPETAESLEPGTMISIKV